MAAGCTARGGKQQQRSGSTLLRAAAAAQGGDTSSTLAPAPLLTRTRAETLGATPPEAFAASSEQASVGDHSSGAPTGAGQRLRASCTESAGSESETTAPVAAAADTLRA